MCMILCGRFLFSALTEYLRQVKLKQSYVDARQTFKVFVLLRYLYFIVVVVPTLVVFYFHMELKGVIFIVFIAVLSFQEILVLIFIYIKITRSSTPLKVQYLENRFGNMEAPKSTPNRQ
jgi:hypothetical protein